MKDKNSALIKAEKIAGISAKEEFYNAEAQNGENGKTIEKQKAKEANRRYKLKKRRELKEQRDYIRAEKKRLKADRKNDKKHGVAAYAIVALSLATLILASALTFTAIMPSDSEKTLEQGYRRALLDTVEQVNNIDLNLSKALASKSAAAQSYLTDIAVNSELAESDIQQLPLKDESKFYTAKVLNQVGDYAKYLNKKIISGEELSEEDYKNLKSLYKANAELKAAIMNAMKNIGADYEYSKMGEKFDGNAYLKEFDKLQELSVEYPELIYDGPFSDGKDSEEIKGENNAEISEQDAMEFFNRLFADYNIKNVTVEDQTEGLIKTYAFSGEVKGENLYAQIAKNGGNLLMFAYSGSCNGINLEEEQAIEIAENFLKKAGYKDLKAVWVNLDNDLYTINFAPEVGGVIIYPDLIKVRVCAETGMTIGIEAMGYYKNHCERTVSVPAIDKSTARESVSKEMEVYSVRLAIVPYGTMSERLCYEFNGVLDGDEYFIYIDALNGRQVEMFKVIDSEQGKMLM